MTMTSRFAWVIESAGSNTGTPLYFTGIDTLGRFTWSYDHSRAVRFCREQDAAAVAVGDGLGSNHRIAEHGWDEGSGAPAGEVGETAGAI